jgi:hypothetical protein
MKQRRKAIIALAVAFYLIQLALLAYSTYLSAKYGTPFSPLLVVGLVVGTAAITVGLTRYLLSALDRAEEAYAAELEDGIEESLASYMETVRAQEAETREIAADIARELAEAREALDDARADETDSHLRRSLELASQTARMRCPNAAVAAILDTKERQCAEAGVTLDAQVALPETLPIPDVELASIFFNLIDNALHECVALMEESGEGDGAEAPAERPTITLRSRIEAGQLLVMVDNPCRTRKRGIDLRSRREQTGGRHGWGTEIVSSTAARHGGIAEFAQEGDTFSAQVMIPLNASSGDGPGGGDNGSANSNDAT